MKYIIFFFSNLLLCLPLPAQLTAEQQIDLYLLKSRQPCGKYPDSARIYLQNALRLSSKTGDKLRRSHALNLLGWTELSQGRYEQAESHLREALRIRKEAKNDSLVVSSLINLGAVLADKGDPDASFEPYEEALSIAGKIRDTLLMAKIFINIANAWDIKEEYDKALSFNYLCQSYIARKPYWKERGLNYHGMGNRLLNIYFNKGKKEDLEKARQCYQQAIENFEKTGESVEIAHSRNGLGATYMYFQEYDKAKDEFVQSIKLCENLKDSACLLDVYYNMANLALAENKSEDALTALTHLQYLIERTGTDNDYIFVKNQFSDSDEKISKTLIDNKISILNAQIQSQKSERIQRTLFFALSILIVAGIAGWLYARQKIRTDRLLLKQQHEIFRQKEQLHLSEVANLLRQQEIEFVRARLEGEEAECHRIARELHDGVGGLLVSAKWNLESALEEVSTPNGAIAAKLKNNLRLQEESYQELRKIVRELERDRIPWWEELQKFCERLSGNAQTGIRFYKHGLDESVGGQLGEEARLVTQELITNALKHAKATQINVQINRVDRILSIVIEDDGIGFDDKIAYSGSGLRNIAERVGRLGGSVSYETGPGSGTTAFIDIPLKT